MGHDDDVFIYLLPKLIKICIILRLSPAINLCKLHLHEKPGVFSQQNFSGIIDDSKKSLKNTLWKSRSLVKMSKRNKNQPKMLPIVLQAIADLRDSRGSTTKKIISRVQKLLDNSKVRPKPRNVVMQVQRAIKHAVKAGVVSQKSGKYKLVRISPVASKNLKPKKSRSKSQFLRSFLDKLNFKSYKRPVEKAQYKPRRRESYSSEYTDESSYTSEAPSYASSYSNASSYSSYHEHRKPARKSKQKYEKRKPAPKNFRKKEEVKNQDKTPTTHQLHSFKRSSQRVVSEPTSRTQDDYDMVGQYISDEQIGSECDNPDCLCNLKQEPLDDIQVQYDDEINCTDYLN